MSKNSKAKRDKNKKTKQKKSNILKSKQPPRKIIASVDDIFDPKKLTTPKEINSDIQEFCSQISSHAPLFIPVTPEPWSRQSCCDLNVKEYIKLNGGEIVCGYKIWYHEPIYIEAERHAVWQKNGEYKEITFNCDGEDKILFIPDTKDKQSTLESNKMKIRWCKYASERDLIDQFEFFERTTPIQSMSNEQAWKTMITYDDWKQGKRMPSIITKKK